MAALTRFIRKPVGTRYRGRVRSVVARKRRNWSWDGSNEFEWLGGTLRKYRDRNWNGRNHLWSHRIKARLNCWGSFWALG